MTDLDLQLREAEIFSALKALPKEEFVVIGGYAVNAYALPRFSVDCDIVVKIGRAAEKIPAVLVKSGYVEVERGDAAGAYGGSFLRFEKILEGSVKASFDVLVGEVFDRRTASSFSAEWVFANSSKKKLPGKTIQEKLDLLVIDVGALVAMKLVASRMSDLRDVFMLLPKVEDLELVRKEVGARTDFGEAVRRAADVLLSKKFRNNLQGVFGSIDEAAFERHVKAFRKLEALAVKC